MITAVELCARRCALTIAHRWVGIDDDVAFARIAWLGAGFVCTCFIVELVLVAPAWTHGWTELDRRQFMADCVTARGITKEGQCAAEFPAYEAAREQDWRR